MRRQPVDALLVALATVGVHAFVAHIAGELGQLRTLALVLEERHREAAGGHDRFDVEQDDLPGARQVGKLAAEVVPGGIPRPHHAPLAIEAQDQRLGREAAKHERQPPVLGNVGRRLALAAGQVQVRHALVVEDAERVVPLGRHVDPAAVGSAGVEEDMLGGNELPQVVIEFGEELRHGPPACGFAFAESLLST